jgi:TRAP-type C4-dicarboxylate transport system substrate-binding protein
VKKRYGVISVVILIVLVALLLPACAEPESTPTATPTSTPTAEPKTLKLSYAMPKGAGTAAGLDWWGPEFEKRTNGRYKVEIYPANSLVVPDATLDATKSGACEIVLTSTGQWPRVFPLSLVCSLPTLGANPENAEDQMAAYDAVWELYNTSPEIRAEYKDYKLVWPYLGAPFYLASKKIEIRSAEDFNGINVGGSGPMMEIVKAYGGATVHEISPEAYNNLDKGVIDAAFLSFTQIKDYKIYDICENFLIQDFGCLMVLVVMNLETWNAMSPEDQAIFDETWREGAEISAEEGMKGSVQGRQETIDAGRTLIEPTAEEAAAWQQAAQYSIDLWVEDCKTAGMSEDTINKVLEAWKAARAKYIK